MEQNDQPGVLTTFTFSPSQFQNLLLNGLKEYFSKNPTPGNNNIGEDPILDITEAAAYIKLSIPSIYRLTGENKLPFMKKGKKLLFSKKALADWLREGRKETLSDIQKNADRLTTVS